MLYLKTLAIFLLTFHCLTLTAQISASGDLVNKIGQIIDDMPGDAGDDYAPPTNPQLADWETCLLNLLQKKYAACEVIANQLDYDLIQFTDNGNNQTYYILENQTAGSNYWGTYVFNPAACQSNLILQAPHPRNDSNTGDQGIYILKEIGALFYMVAGTHRCNSDNYSACSGTTSTCDNGSEKFRDSDMAHIDNSIFHKTTELLLTNMIHPFFIQLHGFSKGTDDPFLILSNSTTIAPPIDYLSKLGDALVNIDPTLTFEIAHLNPTVRLKGTTNTQGRLVNGSSMPCTVASPSNTGQFLHIEQERSKLRADATGWQKMADALKVTFRNLNLLSNPLLLENYAALDTLSAASTIAMGTSSIFKAGKLVRLKDGFHATLGSSFLAQIDGCLSTSPLQRIWPKEIQVHNDAAFFKIAPNPFSQATTIDLILPKAQVMSLNLYNSSGRLIKKIALDQPLPKGKHQFTIDKNDLEGMGIYFLEVVTSEMIKTQQLVLLK